jgi:hypothetical protein
LRLKQEEKIKVVWKVVPVHCKIQKKIDHHLAMISARVRWLYRCWIQMTPILHTEAKAEHRRGPHISIRNLHIRNSQDIPSERLPLPLRAIRPLARVCCLLRP